LPARSGSRSKKSDKSSGTPDLPEVFIDRSLGTDEIAIQLRRVGYTVHTMREVYGEETAQTLKDERWLRKCGREGWVVFSKDKRLRNRRTREYRALVAWGIKAFLLPSGRMGGAEQIARYVDNRYRIALRCKKPGPFIARVEPRSLGWYLEPPKTNP
jgi:hypothetical protein